MNSILMSIKPKWVEKIASGEKAYFGRYKNGREIEVQFPVIL